jgi:hypothetical protein
MCRPAHAPPGLLSDIDAMLRPHARFERVSMLVAVLDPNAG